MQFIAPDVLAAARGLSVGVAGLLTLGGLLLWALGWRWHKFWVVFGITLAAGVVGLTAGEASGGRQVMVVGVLLAVSAGMLALEVAKILSFVTGGVAAWVAAQAVFPQAQELWAVFLSGGLLGVVLYQLWTMLTTSLLGVLVCWHAGLTLAEGIAKGFDAAAFAAKHPAALNGGVIAVAVIGVLVQVRTARWGQAAAGDAKDGGSEDSSEQPNTTRSSWWRWAASLRKAA